MAIMTRCCCCGVRSGSTASGIYSLVISILGTLYFAYSIAGVQISKQVLAGQDDFQSVFEDVDIDSLFNVLTSGYVIAIIVLVALGIASIVLLIGIKQDSQPMLVPYIGASGMHLVWYIYFFVVVIYYIVSLGQATSGLAYVGIILNAALLCPFFIADLVCLLCVISQYQEYSEGRGKASDVV